MDRRWGRDDHARDAGSGRRARATEHLVGPRLGLGRGVLSPKLYWWSPSRQRRRRRLTWAQCAVATPWLSVNVGFPGNLIGLSSGALIGSGQPASPQVSFLGSPAAAQRMPVGRPPPRGIQRTLRASDLASSHVYSLTFVGSPSPLNLRARLRVWPQSSWGMTILIWDLDQGIVIE